jgi:serine/threonine protein kinase
VDPDRIVGTDVAGYAIESVLGHGAMGVVYIARQRSPERRVALKLITPAFAGDEVFRRRFLREATAAAAIEHPHILPVYAAGESNGILFMAMRLVDALDLREILRASADPPLDRVERIVGQVGGALDAAHARGLIHRDVKPGNVLVTEQRDAEDDFCYLMDFGVSTWTASSAATITATGQMVGTANYMAPEQIEGGRVDGATDLYSLGCVLYECLTGEAPFSGRSPPATLYGHLHEQAPAPTSIRPSLPPGVDAVIERALMKAPGERYASCRELTQDLRAAMSGSTGTLPSGGLAAPPGRVPRSRSRGRAIWVAVAASAMALVVAVAGFVFLALRDLGPRHSSSPSASSPQLIREGVQVIASHTAPSSTDAAGNPVTYVPANMIDGNVQTAWRTPGDGHDESVTLIFDNPINIVRIGLIPGYAKTDPQTGADRFLQNRIIDTVAYQVPGLPNTMKGFRPIPVPQFVRLRATTSRITVKILDTTGSGGLDYTAISEIYVFGYQE